MIRTVLTLAGAMPFLAYGVQSHLDIWPFVGHEPYEHLYLTYTLIILSFMAGSVWGYRHDKNQRALPLILSTAIALSGWLGTIFLTPKAFILLALSLFVKLLALDYDAAREGVLSRGYLKLRLTITAIVLLSLISVYLG